MKVNVYETEEEWLEAREPLITGTKRKSIGTKRGGLDKKVGFYQLIAARLAVQEEGDEDPMERGHRLEKEAIQRLSQKTGIEFHHCDKEIWVSEENENMAFSPDGTNKTRTKIAENKSLKSEDHIQAWHRSQMDLPVLKKIPPEYREQAIHPFTVSEKIKDLYFTFFDPRVSAIDFFYIHIKRKDITKEIEKSKQDQLKELAEVDEIVAQLAF